MIMTDRYCYIYNIENIDNEHTYLDVVTLL